MFAAGDTGITVGTADTIVDFTIADDTINVLDAAVARGVTVASGADNTNLADFIVDADAALTVGVGVGVYAEYGIAGDGYAVVDEDNSGSVNEGDTLIVLTGVSLATELLFAPFV